MNGYERSCLSAYACPAFESGQPWSDYGSYGDRYGGVQVLAREGTAWSLVAFEFDYRSHDETFDVFDLEQRQQARDGGAWRPIDVWTF